MRKMLAIGIVAVGCTAMALGAPLAAYSWEFVDNGDDTGTIKVYLELTPNDVPSATLVGWHYELNQTGANFAMIGLDTDLDVPNYYYGSGVTPDIGDYSSYADVDDGMGGYTWPPGNYLIEALTITNPWYAEGLVCFDTTPLFGYNVIYMNGGAPEFVPSENITLPDCLWIPEPAALTLLALGGVALLRRR